MRRLMGPGLTGMVAAICLAAGCFSHTEKIIPPPEHVALCRSVPRSHRSHVHIVFVLGCDVQNKGIFHDLCEYVHELGFLQTYSGCWYEHPVLRSAMRHVKEEDCNARIVLVGYRGVGKYAASLGRLLCAAGVEVEALIDLGCSDDDDPEGLPENIRRVVPAAHDPKGVLAHELSAIAAAIPVKMPPDAPLEWPGPTPYPAEPRVPGTRDQWDFLQPAPGMPLPARPETLPAPRQVPAASAASKTTAQAKSR